MRRRNPIEPMRRELQRAARGHETVTYGRLMKNHRLSRGRKLTLAIAEVDRAEYEKGAPGFAAIIVRKDTGYPGGGYFCDDELPAHIRRPPDRNTDPKLSAAEREHIRRQQDRIWTYYSESVRA